MHYLNVIAVEGGSAEEAVAEAEAFLGGYEDQVWDWYSIGGRWEGFLDGASTMQASVDTARFLAVVDELEQARWANMRELRRHLMGPDGRSELSMALPTGDDAGEVLGRMESLYASDAALFSELMSTERFDRPELEMIGYRMAKLGRLVAGYFEADSLFYDAAYGDASPAALRGRVLEDPDRQWLVVADLHM